MPTDTGLTITMNALDTVPCEACDGAHQRKRHLRLCDACNRPAPTKAEVRAVLEPVRRRLVELAGLLERDAIDSPMAFMGLPELDAVDAMLARVQP